MCTSARRGSKFFGGACPGALHCVHPYSPSGTQAGVSKSGGGGGAVYEPVMSAAAAAIWACAYSFIRAM